MAAPDPVKLIMTWDIAPSKEREYFEFVIRTFLPAIQNLGLEINEAWATAYGNAPQIQVSAQMPSLLELQQILRSSEWMDLHSQLMDYIINYHQKVTRALTRFQF